MKRKRNGFLSILLCITVLAVMLPQTVQAMTGETVVSEKGSTIIYHPEEGSLPSNEELFEGYVGRRMYGEISLFGWQAGNALPYGSLEEVIYSELKTKAAKVADGEVSSASFSIEADISALKWTAAELGCTLVEGGVITEAAKAAVAEKFAAALDTQKLLNCLLGDLPYELYWFDKTVGIKTSYQISGSNAELSITNLVISFAVAEDYRGSDLYTVDTSKTGAVSTAIANANAIVDANAEKSDLQKLEAYRAKICELVSYNNEAVEGSVSYGDPWQIIYVLDGNPDTNVVCEGYAKAFQYLCDLSCFNERVICYTVTGTMSGGIGAGSHMWNVVQMNGKNYLVDLTNCDAGMIGADTNLFMVGVKGTDANKVHTFTIDGSNVVYTYGEEQNGLYGDGYLALTTNTWTDSDHYVNGEEYKYVGPSSLSKTQDGQPVKVLFEDILVTANLMVDTPANKTWMNGKYFVGEWCQVKESGITPVEGTIEWAYDSEYDCDMEYAWVGPTEPGDYRFILRCAFPEPGAGELVYLSKSFTISPSIEHTHSYGAWEKVDNNTHKQTCVCGDEKTEAHTWNVGVVTTQPTHTTEGVKTYTCIKCDATKTEAVAKLTEHSYGIEWVQGRDTHWHECICGDKIEVTEHTFGAWQGSPNGHYRQCTICDYTESGNHDYSGSSNDSCIVCGYIEPGKIVPDTNADDNVLNAILEQNVDFASVVLNEEERVRVENGEDVVVSLEVSDVSATVSDSDKEKVASVLGENTVGMYLDINLYNKIGSDYTRQVTQTNGKVAITVSVPDHMISQTDTDYSYKIIRIHEGNVTVLDGVFDKEARTFTFQSDQFSTYALVYSVQETGGAQSGSLNSNTSSTAKSVQSGDSSVYSCWMLLIAVSGVAIIGLLNKRRRNVE